MPIEAWLAYVAATAILLVIPGPTILTVISYSMAQGKRARLPLVAAVALGDSTALVLSLLGLGTLFLPQFIDRHADIDHQLWVLAITFVVMATINATLYAVFAATAASFLASRRAKRGFNLAGGSLLSIAGAWALLAKRATS